jgi:hypothetical protein
MEVIVNCIKLARPHWFQQNMDYNAKSAPNLSTLPKPFTPQSFLSQSQASEFIPNKLDMMEDELPSFMENFADINSNINHQKFPNPPPVVNSITSTPLSSTVMGNSLSFPTFTPLPSTVVGNSLSFATSTPLTSNPPTALPNTPVSPFLSFSSQLATTPSDTFIMNFSTSPTVTSTASGTYSARMDRESNMDSGIMTFLIDQFLTTSVVQDLSEALANVQDGGTSQ